MAARPLRPYERFHANASHWSSRFRDQVEAKLAGGWPSDGEVLPSLAPPIAWHGANRPFSANLHAWWPLALLFQAHSQFGEARYIEEAWPFARDWIASFWRPLAGRPEQAAVEAALSGATAEAWYDMAVGLRIYRLAYLLDVACRDPGRPDEEVGELAAALGFHHRLLAEPRMFKGHNNHGVFQALGQLAAARRIPELSGDAGERAAEKLRDCVRSQFFESGVHREHSPGYHQALLKVLIGARDDGLLSTADLDWIARAEEALGWMIAPNGGLAPIGDTDRKWFNLGNAFVRRFSDPTARALLSLRRLEGEVRLGVRAFPDAGYVFARLADSGGGQDVSAHAYLAQTAAFHSRTHKHADDLSFVWWDRGCEILTDPGRFAYLGKTPPGSPEWRDGFWYADPRRMFVERTRAHNAVEVDGRDHRRAGIEPFGSALVSAGECDGTVLTECAFTGGDGLRFRRVLAMRPGRFLLVLDEVEAAAGGEHAFRQWFTLAPGWSAEPDGGGLLARRDGEGGGVLRVLSLTDGATLEGPWRGQEEPELLGWVAETPNRLAPATTFALRQGGAAARFTTLFTFAEDAAPVSVKAAGVDEAGFCWREGGREVTLTLGRDGLGRIRGAFTDQLASGTPTGEVVHE